MFDMSILDVGDVILIDEFPKKFLIMNIETHPDDKKYSVAHATGILTYDEWSIEEYLSNNTFSIKKPFAGLELI